MAVIPSRKAIEQLAAEQRQTGNAVNPLSLVYEMSLLSKTGALPVRVDQSANRRRLLVHTRRYRVGLYPTQYGDAYSLGHVNRLTFRDQEMLFDGALLVGTQWVAYQHVRDVPRGSSAYWELLVREWQTVSQAPPPQPQHLTYLDLLTTAVEATRDIEVARQRQTRPMLYRRRKSTREERHSARPVYEFHLVRPATVAPNAVVYVGDDPGLRARVIRAENREIVVRFETTVDYDRIPPQGALQLLPSDRVYRTQLETIDAIRKREVVNPGLLDSVLLGRPLAPCQPDPEARPREDLDRDQLLAFRGALAVPDLLLVLGPPGAGKTRTIRQIAVESAARGRQVLITSHTNRAVDNVLSDLPSDIRAVRLGNEGSMTSHARTLMVDEQVGALRDEILAATAGEASRLADFGGDSHVVEGWLTSFSTRHADAEAAEGAARTTAAELRAAVDRAVAPVADRITAAQAALAASERDVERTEWKAARRQQWAERASARAGTGVLGALFRWLAGYHTRRLDALRQALEQARHDLAGARAAHGAVQAEAAELAARDPEAAGARQAAARAEEALGSALDQVRAAAKPLVARLTQAGQTAPAAPADVPGWSRFRDWLRATVPLLQRRAGLLQQWRGHITQAEEDLQREYVRYADVVAATCVGTATSPLLAGHTFDLAIVDEAGQISTPNLLVPLVRARRSVLVGDHHQLPPFLDHEVRGWVKGLARDRAVPPAAVREIRELLHRSTFERLYEHVDPTHRVMLTVQRRMPEAIANFVSRAFYRGELRTRHGGVTAGSAFSSPFAMVDTADEPPARRCETPAKHQELFGEGGYVNRLEAELIAALIGRHARHYRDWAVVVPYRAQAALVTKLLTEELGDAGRVEDNVGSVDSFQGGEKDLIVYGFTRSNSRGEIGFLSELRRINVAITRAKQQLVLVGDSSTLRAAKDDGFAELMRAMTDYLARDGDVCPSRQLHSRLDRLGGNPS